MMDRGPKLLLAITAALLTTACASVSETQRLNGMVRVAEINGRTWDFARDGEYLYVRPSGLQSYVNDLRFKREVVAAAETYSGCRFTDPTWSEELFNTWTAMGRLSCGS